MTLDNKLSNKRRGHGTFHPKAVGNTLEIWRNVFHLEDQQNPEIISDAVIIFIAYKDWRI